MEKVNLCGFEKVTIEIPKQFAFCLTETQQIVWLYNELLDLMENGGHLKVRRVRAVPLVPKARRDLRATPAP